MLANNNNRVILSNLRGCLLLPLLEVSTVEVSLSRGAPSPLNLYQKEVSQSKDDLFHLHPNLSLRRRTWASLATLSRG